MRLTAPRLIVFDLDGTLVDSRRDLADSANVMLGTYGRPPLDQDAVVRMVGEGARVLVERVLAASNVSPPIDEALARFLAIYNGHLVDHTRPYDGVAETVAELAAQVPLAVVTNKPRDPAATLLAHFGLASAFVDVIGGDGPLPRKPAPEAVLAVASRLGVSPIDVWFVGDSAVDVETAARGGMRLVLARYGFGAVDLALAHLPADALVIDHPSELAALVAAAPGRGAPQAESRRG